MRSITPKHQRRFSLQIGIPALMMVVAIGYALQWSHHRERSRPDALAPSSRVGGSASYKTNSPATELTQRVEPPLPPWLSNLLPADRLSEITSIDQITSSPGWWVCELAGIMVSRRRGYWGDPIGSSTSSPGRRDPPWRLIDRGNTMGARTAPLGSARAVGERPVMGGKAKKKSAQSPAQPAATPSAPPPPPVIHEATLLPSGALRRGNVITRATAETLRRHGQDVVVCGQQHRANMNLARDIGHSA